MSCGLDTAWDIEDLVMLGKKKRVSHPPSLLRIMHTQEYHVYILISEEYEIHH